MEGNKEDWAAHVAAMERDAVPTSVYAKRHGLALHRVYYWRRKLTDDARALTGSEEQTPTFVALRVAEPVATPQATSCTLVLGPGVRLELPTMPSAEWLAALGRAVQGQR
jgi:transposase-like protein